ncbi:MAG: DUF1223 domain-containing protein [Acidiferrobacterales bacterium]|nr:DUF1223 domain-containing protein [Acidiferrobacterales bacterium]
MLIGRAFFQTLIVAGMAVTTMLTATSLEADSKVKHVFELFTSQSCYSCPPAEKLLGEIIDENDEILGLEFHVDYWDNLVYGSAGKWRDPYSSAEYSKRQRDYNRLRLKGRKGVYTPQMIVNGRHAFVGSKISKANQHIKRESDLVLDLDAVVSESGDLVVSVKGEHDTRANVWLVIYEMKHVTEVPSGENKGKTLENFNVVRDLKSIGKWRGMPVEYETEVGVLDENQHCAVIVQQYDSFLRSVSGPIIGAAICKVAS